MLRSFKQLFACLNVMWILSHHLWAVDQFIKAVFVISSLLCKHFHNLQTPPLSSAKVFAVSKMSAGKQHSAP